MSLEGRRASALVALVSTPLVLHRRAKARNTFSLFLTWKTAGDGHTNEERNSTPSAADAAGAAPSSARALRELAREISAARDHPDLDGNPDSEAPTRTPGAEYIWILGLLVIHISVLSQRLGAEVFNAAVGDGHA
ncbi:hypothetical protein B0H14DRAFT_3439915 [Mycena olivaceomarginata]|nr:hypothetical protein B0H14DRAFT_3439915 [Mycena olivaceomarginata]